MRFQKQRPHPCDFSSLWDKTKTCGAENDSGYEDNSVFQAPKAMTPTGIATPIGRDSVRLGTHSTGAHETLGFIGH